MSRSKIIQLDERFEKTGEPTVQPVVLWGYSGKPCYERLTKEASASPALDYIKTVQPIPGRTVVLVIGLGSYEYYGLNRNGDGFNEQPYKMGHKPTCGCCGDNRDAWVLEKECIQHHYQTYEQGRVYRSHVNKNPDKAIGKILKAFWNSYMHRVEVLKDIDNALASDITGRIADGEYVACSMGCRISFDVCTVCGHQAPTRKHYCDHLKFQLCHLDPKTGIRYGALNPAPRFFDSSIVVRPADRTGYMLKKVAEHAPEIRTSSELGDLMDHLQAKSATAKKLAVIDKIVQGYPAKAVGAELPEAALIEQYKKTGLQPAVNSTPELKLGELQTLTPFPLAETLAMLSKAGILLTTPEFIQLFIEKMAPGAVLPSGVLENAVQLQGCLFDFFAKNPSLLSELMDTLHWPQGGISPEVKEAVAPLMEKRSYISGYLYRRMMPSSHRMQESPRTELLTVEDPHTKQQYNTTRGAVWKAEDELAKAQLRSLVGGGLALAGAHRALSGGHLATGVPLTAAGLFLGHQAVKPRPEYTTTSGEGVPYLTEFTPKYSHDLSYLNSVGMEQKYMKKVAAQNIDLDALLSPYKEASDGISEEHIPLEKVAEVLGELLWRNV